MRYFVVTGLCALALVCLSYCTGQPEKKTLVGTWRYEKFEHVTPLDPSMQPMWDKLHEANKALTISFTENTFTTTGMSQANSKPITSSYRLGPDSKEILVDAQKLIIIQLDDDILKLQREGNPVTVFRRVK